MRRYIVAYDISDDAKRLRVAAMLLARGVRLQKSVFEVTTDDIAGLLTTVAEQVDVGHDAVAVFPQCATCADRQQHIGQAGPRMHDRWWVA